MVGLNKQLYILGQEFYLVIKNNVPNNFCFYKIKFVPNIFSKNVFNCPIQKKAKKINTV